MSPSSATLTPMSEVRVRRSGSARPPPGRGEHTRAAPTRLDLHAGCGSSVNADRRYVGRSRVSLGRFAVLDLDGEVRLSPGERGQDVVQDLFGGRAELSAARRHLEPAGLVAVIALREVFGADDDHVAVVGEVHLTSSPG